MSNKKKNGEFCWNELMTIDTHKARDFYSKMFDWESTEHEIDDITYTIFKSGDNDVAGMIQIPKEKENEIPPNWLSYIKVDHLDAAIKKAKDLGATIIVSEKVLPDYGRLSVLKDPSGAHVALWERK